ncbi:helix-turn-helix domain-containing protein [Sphingobacterium daejeonense]|uniref:helix-turn-helix domain-containing protein n=1 Tax=Sphingobacterium daejeonense TaxID=371142 RepID=UPI0010C49CA3|nr:AraC family transcriptional regulator [Sphingobacterium daejeonense]VTP91739.1 L-rhamnose operon transcriptional activator rhaR [Sphingobacterium daejeonense]
MELNELVTTSGFIKRFLSAAPKNHKWQTTPLQVYPLNFVAKYLETPLPALRANNNTFIHLTKGKIDVLIGRDSYEISAPALLSVFSGTVHSLRSISGCAEGYLVLLEQLTMSVMLRHHALLKLFIISPVLNLCHEQSGWLGNINNLLLHEIEKAHPNRNIVHGLLQAKLYHVLDLSSARKPVCRSQAIAIAFKTLVHAHHLENKNVSFYAERLHISENYLNRCIKETLRMTAKEVILEVLMIHAQYLLWNLTKSVAEVSYECNIDDPSYFARLFKKLRGYSPTRYRELFVQGLS